MKMKHFRKIAGLLLTGVMALSSLPQAGMYAGEPSTEASVIDTASSSETADPELLPQSDSDGNIPNSSEEISSVIVQTDEASRNETQTDGVVSAETSSEELAVIEDTPEEPTSDNETELSDRRTLTADNFEDIRSEKSSGMTVDMLLSVRIAAETGFSEDKTLKIHVLRDEEAESAASRLRAYLGDERLKDEDIVLPADLFINDGSGSRCQDLGHLEVCIELDDTDILTGCALYHERRDGSWEKVEYSVEKGSGDKKDTLSFSSDQDLNTYLFVKEPSEEQETEADTDPSTEPDAENQSGDSTEKASDTEDQSSDSTEKASDTEDQCDDPSENEQGAQGQDTEDPYSVAPEQQEEQAAEDGPAPGRLQIPEKMVSALPRKEAEAPDESVRKNYVGTIETFAAAFDRGGKKTENIDRYHTSANIRQNIQNNSNDPVTDPSETAFMWTPDENMTGHRYIYDVVYSFSGKGELPASTPAEDRSQDKVENYPFLIRVPLHMLMDRNGEWGDQIDLAVPSEEVAKDDPDATIVWREATGNDPLNIYKDEKAGIDYGTAVIYNRKAISCAQNGYVQMAYETMEDPFQYKDNTLSDLFRARLNISNPQETTGENTDAEDDGNGGSTGSGEGSTGSGESSTGSGEGSTGSGESGTGSGDGGSSDADQSQDSHAIDPIDVKASRIGIDTYTDIKSTNNKYPSTYRTWQKGWGDDVKPEKPEDYYYLVWEVESYVGPGTQPYNFTLTDNPVTSGFEETVLGYKMQGASVYSANNTVYNLTDGGKRWDYVLTAISVAKYNEIVNKKGGSKYILRNSVTATVTPLDQIDEEVDAVSTQKITFWPPEFYYPGGFWTVKHSGNWSRELNWWEGQKDYRLREFSLGPESETGDGIDAIDRMDYYIDVDSWLSSPLLVQGTDPMNVDNYKVPVTYEVSDDTVYYEDFETPLSDKDYRFDFVNWQIAMRDAQITYDATFNPTLGAKNVEYADTDIVYVYTRGTIDGKKFGWTVAAQIYLKKHEVQVVDSSIVKDGGSCAARGRNESGGTIRFNQNVNGVRFVTSNAHYSTTMNLIPSISLLRTDTTYKRTLDSSTKDGIKDTTTLRNRASVRVYSAMAYDTSGARAANDSIKETNLNSSQTVADYVTYLNSESTSIPSCVYRRDVLEEDSYIKKAVKESSIRKYVMDGKNDALRKRYILTWDMLMNETVTANQDGSSVVQTNPIRQTSGTFYDLIPKGATVDPSSVQVYDSQGSVGIDEAWDDILIDPEDYTVSTETDWRNTGRQMLKVSISEPASSYRIVFKTYYPWEALRDYGSLVLNVAAYETGNRSITLTKEKNSDQMNGGLDGVGRSWTDDALGEKVELKNLDPEGDQSFARFLYTSCLYDVAAITAAHSGLTKGVRNSSEDRYSRFTKVFQNETYAYQLRYANSPMNESKDIVLFDSIEDFTTEEGKSSEWKGKLKSIDVSGILAKNEVVDDEGKVTGYRKPAPVVYVSEKNYSDIKAEIPKLTGYDGSSSNTKYNYQEHPIKFENDPDWVKLDDYKASHKDQDGNADLSGVKSVAVDARKNADGSEFILQKGDSFSVVLYLEAPEGVETNLTVDADGNPLFPKTYNKVWGVNTEFTQAGKPIPTAPMYYESITAEFHMEGRFTLFKYDAGDENKGVKGVTFRISGKSKFGTDINISKTTNSQGLIDFTGLEETAVGSPYILVETSGPEDVPDYLPDHSSHTVEVDYLGNVTIDGTPLGKGQQYRVPNTPRVHADISFTKMDSIFHVTKLRGAKFRITGTSDYGTDILKYAESDEFGHVLFRNIEKGTYQLQEILAPYEKKPDGSDYDGTQDGEEKRRYILDPTIYELKIDESGGYKINVKDNKDDLGMFEKDESGDWSMGNESHHRVEFVKRSSWDNAALAGAEFNLSGISDYGTAVNSTVSSDENGKVTFDGLEPGSYVLKETKAPVVEVTETAEDGTQKEKIVSYKLDETQHLVTVHKDGTFEIDGLTLKPIVGKDS